MPRGRPVARRRHGRSAHDEQTAGPMVARPDARIRRNPTVARRSDRTDRRRVVPLHKQIGKMLHRGTGVNALVHVTRVRVAHPFPGCTTPRGRPGQAQRPASRAAPPRTRPAGSRPATLIRTPPLTSLFGTPKKRRLPSTALTKLAVSGRCPRHARRASPSRLSRHDRARGGPSTSSMRCSISPSRNEASVVRTHPMAEHDEHQRVGVGGAHDVSDAASSSV